MPLYDYECSRCGRRKRVFRSLRMRNRRPRCSEDKRLMNRKYSLFGIGGSYLDQSMYGHEQKAWAMATGEKHATSRELVEWCGAHGKTIVEKGWKPKSADQMFDEEIERDLEPALEKTYRERHDLGEI